MAIEQVNFAAQVSDFVNKTQQRLEAVFRESTQRVVAYMQMPVAEGGNMPVDTGFLRAGLRVTKDAPLPLSLDRPSDSATYSYNPANLVIASAKVGDTIYASYTANYAGFVNYGRSGSQGRHFVDLAAQRWPAIVEEVCRELQGRVEGTQSGG